MIIGDPNNALAKHRAFLRRLEIQKVEAREDDMLKTKLDDLKSHNFKARAAEQREKINNLKDTDQLIAEAEAAVSEPAYSEKAASEVPSKKVAKKAAKPAWAATERQNEE